MELFFAIVRFVLFCACAIPASKEDANTGQVARKWTDYALIIVPFLNFATGRIEDVEISFAAASSAVLFCSLVSTVTGVITHKKGFGAADTRMAGVIGALAGFPIFLFAICIAAILSIPYSIAAPHKRFPFVPSLTVGTAWSFIFLYTNPLFFRAETLVLNISIAGWQIP